MLRTKQAALREEVTHLLVPGAGIYLSETEWLGLIATDKPFLPEEINQWRAVGNPVDHSHTFDRSSSPKW